MRLSARTIAIRYALALGLVVLATLARLALAPLLGETLPFVTYYLVAAISAVVLGFGPSLVVLGLGGALAMSLFMRPRISPTVDDERMWVALGFFLFVGLVNTLLSEAMRRARRQALDGQDALRREMAVRVRAEGELRDREIRFRALVERSSDVVTLVGPDGTFLYVSPASRGVTGYEAEELEGTSGLALIHPDDLAEATARLAELVGRPGETIVSRLRLQHRDGSWRWLENVATNWIREPSIAAVVINSRDVTERVLMERRAGEAEARFRAFMDNSPAIGYLKDEAGRYVWGNRAWCRLFDRPEAALMGRDDLALWPEETARRFRESDLRALDAGGPIEALETVGDRHYMSFKFPLELAGGRFLGGMTLDITDRVEAEGAVRKSERLLHALADSMPQIVWAAGPDGHLDYYNRRWYEYTGFSEEESLSAEGWKPILHPDDVARCDDAWSQSVATGRPYQIEYRFRDRQTGGYRWFLGRALPVRDEAGAIVRWYGTCTDIDDQKRAEQAAESANLAKDRFLAVLSHELRTPLTPILLSASSMIDRPSVTDEVRQLLEMVLRNVTLESRLIDDLLNITRISRGSFVIEKETVDAGLLLAQAVEICRGDVDDAGLSIALELSARSTTVSADPARLPQAFWNVIKNAVKFNPRGGTITIRTSNERGPNPDDEDRLIVEVSDTGIGIAPEFLPRMFDAFEQGESSAWTRRFGGLGLGLAISRSIVEAHGGEISARSAGPGLGATFRIVLPTIPSAPPAEPKPTLVPALATPPRAHGPSPLHILLVEDDPSTLSVLARLLRHSRHEVTTACSVSSALAAADLHRDAFDLIISDIGLPDGNGVDLMRVMQARRPFPAIALTGYGMVDDVKKSLAAGFKCHLTKPIDFRALEAAIGSVVNGAS